MANHSRNPQPPSLGRLIACLERQARRHFERELAACGLGANTHRIISMLHHRGGCHQNELSEALVLDKATMSRTVKKLMETGYVRRERDASDGRAYRITLTSKAAVAMASIRAARRLWTRILSAGLSTQEQAVAVRLLQRMHENALAYRHGLDRKKT
jgi:DNA-binding MarR family transcriptional regulator